MDMRTKIIKSGRMTEEKLDAAVKAKMKEGARTEQSALNKVFRDIAIETVGKEDIPGYWLQIYVKKNNRGISGYLQKEDGSTIKVAVVEGTPKPEVSLGRPLGIADPVVLTNCVKKKNVFSGVTFYETTKDTSVKEAPISTPLVDCCADFSEKMADGIYAIRAQISRVWGVRPFGSKDKEMLPILDRGDIVNLRLVLESKGSQLSVKIPDAFRLKMLLGEDLEWLDGDGAIKELSDCLRGISVVVFGRMNTCIFRGKPEEKKTNPFFQITNFGFVLPVNEKGEKDVVATAAEVDEDEEGHVEEP
jgi:hypothetical protein